MSETPGNPLMKIGGKVIGPVANLLGLEAKLERLVDKVTRLREDQIILQSLTTDINARSISNRDMAVDHKQQNDRACEQTNLTMSELKKENIELRKEIGDLKQLVVELQHKIEIDAKNREIDLLKFKESLVVEFVQKRLPLRSVEDNSKP